MTARLLDGIAVANQIRAESAPTIAAFTTNRKSPSVTSVRTAKKRVTL